MISLPVTVRAFTRDLQLAVKRLFKRACDDTSVSLASIGDGLERSHALPERWADDRADRHLPLYALASTTAIPERLYTRLIHDIDELRHAQNSHGVVPNPLGACAALLTRQCESVSLIVESLKDARITSAERRPILKKLAEIEASIAVVRRAFDYENETTARAS